MKKSKHPGLRAKSYKTVGGRVLVYYVYDMRGTGKKDIRLGSDYASAIEQWHKLHNHIPLTIGRVQEAIDQWREQILPAYESANTRAQYKSYLKNIEAAFGQMAWHEIKLSTLQIYLNKRSAKVSANRELAALAVVWGQARKWGMTEETYPARGLAKFGNAEPPRKVEVTDAMFDAIYSKADRILRDAMDIATATGMRITDVRTVRMPIDGKLRFKANKTDKWAYFEVADSPVLSAMVERRQASKAHCVMLLASDTGRAVSEWMLCEKRWNEAKQAAIKAFPRLKADLSGLYLRDLRKRAADLADDMESASKLLQHSSTRLTERHYRNKPVKLEAVR